ncbi:MAG: hypothetical protein K0Q71_3813 [Thermomicrobiales bacterium]|nr:hypothetical protein [Thermomicrobiales bacterium]
MGADLLGALRELHGQLGGAIAFLDKLSATGLLRGAGSAEGGLEALPAAGPPSPGGAPSREWRTLWRGASPCSGGAPGARGGAAGSGRAARLARP